MRSSSKVKISTIERTPANKSLLYVRVRREPHNHHEEKIEHDIFVGLQRFLNLFFFGLDGSGQHGGLDLNLNLNSAPAKLSYFSTGDPCECAFCRVRRSTPAQLLKVSSNLGKAPCFRVQTTCSCYRQYRKSFLDCPHIRSQSPAIEQGYLFHLKLVK